MKKLLTVLLLAGLSGVLWSADNAETEKTKDKTPTQQQERAAAARKEREAAAKKEREEQAARRSEIMKQIRAYQALPDDQKAAAKAQVVALLRKDYEVNQERTRRQIEEFEAKLAKLKNTQQQSIDEKVEKEFSRLVSLSGKRGNKGKNPAKPAAKAGRKAEKKNAPAETAPAATPAN